MPDPHETPDLELYHAFRNGDVSAFGRLVERHQGALLRQARALLGSRGGHEDVVQDVFLKLAQRPPEALAFTADSAAGGESGSDRRLLAWLYQVTRNGCMDQLRMETRRRSREEATAREEATRGDGHVVDGSDTRALVEREIARLPEDQREVLALRLLGERSYREVAHITGRKLGTVAWLVAEGLKVLSARLAPVVQEGRATVRTPEPPPRRIGDYRQGNVGGRIVPGESA